MSDAIVYNTFTLDLNIGEDILPYVRTAVLIKKQVTEFHTTGENYYPYNVIYWGEFSELYHLKLSKIFKKISAKSNPQEKFRLYVDVKLYARSDIRTNTYGDPIELMLLVYYKNNKGQYEIRKLQA